MGSTTVVVGVQFCIIGHRVLYIMLSGCGSLYNNVIKAERVMPLMVGVTNKRNDAARPISTCRYLSYIFRSCIRTRTKRKMS